MAAFGAEANPLAQDGIGLPRRQRRALPGDRASAHGDDAGDGQQRRAFARAVRAEQRDDLALADLEREALQHFDRAITGVDLVELQHG